MGCGVITREAEALGVKAGVNVLEDVSTDFTGAGVSVKSTPLKKGMKVFQHKHEYDHLSVLISGTVILQNDDETVIIDAQHGPRSVVVKAGKIHSVIALTDAVWLCVHKEGVL